MLKKNRRLFFPDTVYIKQNRQTHLVDLFYIINQTTPYRQHKIQQTYRKRTLYKNRVKSKITPSSQNYSEGHFSRIIRNRVRRYSVYCSYC